MQTSLLTRAATVSICHCFIIEDSATATSNMKMAKYVDGTIIPDKLSKLQQFQLNFELETEGNWCEVNNLIINNPKT